MTLQGVTPSLIRPLHACKLVVLDMTGTTVVDEGLVDQAFSRALVTEGITEGTPQFLSMMGYARDTMGISKATVFRHLFDADPVRAAQANRTFEKSYDAQVLAGGISPVPGAEEAISWLREAGVKVCLVTGFTRHTQNIVLESLGWMGLADLSLCPDDAGRGRPYPDMILTAVLALDMDDVRQTVVVGDTTADVQAGLRAGASRVVGVLTGAHHEQALRASGATDIVPSVKDMPELLRPQLGRFVG
ncbi:phosphonatase-like hydrolase [Psychromicrobium xiongbiense]|uniref:phosphonatase-like hydrolase n=1 Tax=Psychromicrobium xiongbiense TaxID=3051184 RepID=UPI00255316B9|nr:phosphonatase-like hydrolase [Psychromicrobium sp. YIM S02556]